MLITDFEEGYELGKVYGQLEKVEKEFELVEQNER